MMPDAMQVHFHPVICAWFKQKFGQCTAVQEKAWSTIAGGAHTLIASPTGSGKTLAALLPCLERIIQSKIQGNASSGVQVIYVTPLKALNNDIHDHIVKYIHEIEKVAEEHNMEWPGIRAAVRTGDTTASTRASMLRTPPDLLITTPESLYILLTSRKAREILKTTEQVIVDEIHDLAASRRGTHLSITLERLVEWCGTSFQRIGVSATQKPMERIARFLGGWDDSEPRPVTIVENHSDKQIHLQVLMPNRKTITADKENFWTPIVEQLIELMNGRETVLIFVNNRRLCERLALRINDHIGYEMARSHHGSVSKEKRLEVEQLLKSGQLRCLIATSSLELGIDVGHIDLVIQMDSPKQAAAGIQRFGRAGHRVDGISHGAIIVKNRAELMEAAVLGQLIANREIEDIHIPRLTLDIIAQQVVAMVACDDWTLERLYAVLNRSDSGRDYSQHKLKAMLKVLSGLYPFARPLMDWDVDQDELRSRKNTSMAALMGAGTIQQGSNYPVHHVDTRVHIGELDEEYVHESRIGDVFQLGVTSWRIQAITNHHVYVTESRNQFSEIPFWKGEALGRSYALGEKIGRFLKEITAWLESDTDEELIRRLKTEYDLDTNSANELVRMVKQQQRISVVPTHDQLVIETFEDEIQHTHVLIHSLFGRRLNRTWMLALKHLFEINIRGQYYAYCKDNGIEFVFPEWDPANIKWVTGLKADQLEPILMEVIPSSPQFGMTFRRMAEMSLLLMRSYQRTPVALQRLRSEELLKASLPYAEHFPLIDEAIQDCLHEQLDMTGLRRVLQAIDKGDIRVAIRSLRYPSAFARMIMSDVIGGKIYEGESISKELQVQLVGIHKHLATEWFGDQAIGEVISPDVIAKEKDRLQSYGGLTYPSNEDGLYDLLKKRGDLSLQEIGEQYGGQMKLLHAQGRVVPIQLAGEQRWICRDEEEIYKKFPGDEMSLLFVLSRYIETRLSFSANDLAHRYRLTSLHIQSFIERCIEESWIDEAPAQLGNNGTTWISRSILSRLIRQSVRSFQEENGPVDASRFLQFMLECHGLFPVARRSGAEGLKQIIEMLQGVFLPWSQWEAMVFPARLIEYRKEDLDLLCASGEVIWVGRKLGQEKEGRVAFFLTDTDLRYSYIANEGETKHPELLQLLEEKGAAFLTTIARDLNVPPSEALDMLFDLVWEGRVSNDQCAPLRQHYMRTTRSKRSAHSGFGRWYRLDAGCADNAEPMLHWIQLHAKRNGVLCKSIVDENSPYRWDVISEQLRQFESWGMMVRGFFIEGIPSIQFAMKENIEQLRASSKPTVDYGDQASQQLVVLSSTDPANPFGVLMPWPTIDQISFARKPGNYMVMYRGDWVLWVENNGRRINVLEEKIVHEWAKDKKLMMNILRTVFRRIIDCSGLRKISMELWNGESIHNDPVSEYLIALGAERDRSYLVLWPSFN